MHLLATDTRSLDDAETAVDLGQNPADLVFLSFSDSDLGAAASAWQSMDDRPLLRLANLARLRHPMSVDLYLDRVVSHARCVVVRLLGSLKYWRYGAEELSALCRRDGIALALLPGDGRDDGRLAALSTVATETWGRLDALMREGGAANMRRALDLMIRRDAPGEAAEAMPAAGEFTFDESVAGPVAAVVFYRSHLLAGDVAPIVALARALAARGLSPRGMYVTSLKDEAAVAFARERLEAWRPAVVLNATAFSARRDGVGSPLDVAPVLQVVLSGSPRQAWAASSRGVSQTDLAMQVVLPELDGRLLTTAISFKAPDAATAELQWSRVVHRPDAAGIALAADRAAGWARLAGKRARERRVAIVLSDYPGGGQRAHAVGLDTLASLTAICGMLRDAGYAVGDDVAQAIRDDVRHPAMSRAEYRRAFATLPEAFRGRVLAAWGEPDASFDLCVARSGNVVVAVQPDRRAGYHDPDVPPCHAYIAFYLSLRDVDAMVHLGTHGTLEWLPGKAVALSGECDPVVLSGGVPVVYPFIVNNPGEAACAKRRLGAVTIGHLTPPLRTTGAEGAVAELERLIDEYAAADGLDSRRTSALRGVILERASALGLSAEARIPTDATASDALARLDAYLCDVKQMQVRDGLHVFGVAPTADRLGALLDATRFACPETDDAVLRARLSACASGERAGLLAALDGRFVQPGPGGAPSRGRADVLPTGRNIATIDPRGVPTRSAMALAERAAADVLTRHRQDYGDWPRSIMLDLWGSATMRTGGEDLALALVLLGVRPVWDGGSARVTGFEVVPIALLERPRVDVTLRISGLFRDAFPTQVALFDDVVRAVAARDEAADWNPLAHAAPHKLSRIFGAAPGAYGSGAETPLEQCADRDAVAEAYLAYSGFAYGRAAEGVADADGFAARVGRTDAFVHTQDHRDTDVLDAIAFAAHEGGFAAAAASLGAAPALYHADTSRPDAPRIRALSDEIDRVVRGRAASPGWIAGMMRHQYRGAAEIARGVANLCAFAATLDTRFDRQFDLLFDATLGDAEVDTFLRHANPEAHAAMRDAFASARRRGLWRVRRNEIPMVLA